MGKINLVDSATRSFVKTSCLSSDQKRAALLEFARSIEREKKKLLTANQKDLNLAKGLSPALRARLVLTEPSLATVVGGLRALAKLPDPCGRILSKTLLDDGLVLEKVSVPLGVVLVIFESRPDVIPQILSLILKSGNVGILKGGREARHTNLAFMKLVGKLASKFKFLPPAWAQYVESRAEVKKLLKHSDKISLVIPRGSNALVKSIQSSTAIPVLGHAEGICHIFVDESANLEQALEIVIDAKVQSPSACNSLDTLLLHQKIAKKFLNLLEQRALKEKIELLFGVKNWRSEYGDLRLAIKIVDDVAAAVAHINLYGSHHTDAICSRTKSNIERFLREVDSSSVIANASTRFADGYRYGLGAEVGISTHKLHARGPVGVEGLTLYKFILRGSGQKVAEYVGKNPRKKFKHSD